VNTLQRYLKDPVSGLMHVASALGAAAGLPALWWLSPPEIAHRIALTIYGASMVLLFTASSLYHLIRTSPRWEAWLRRLDHTAIFVFIAGTYTPVCVIVLSGAWQWGLLVAVWSLAAAGIFFKLIYIQAPRWISVGLYVFMGWLGVIGVAQLLQALPVSALAWLLAGGLLYTAGAVVYATRRWDFFPGVFGFHEVWHVFVSAASGLHYIFILLYIAPFGAR
jgi:hemolysin III